MSENLRIGTQGGVAGDTSFHTPAGGPEIHLVRHGHHPEGFRGRWSHHSLSRLGEIQSALLAELMRREGTRVDTLITSDLPRARETAEILAQAVNVPVSSAQDWREVNNGVLAGMPDERAQAMYPGLYWSSLELDQPYPGGESPAAFYHRIEGAFRNLCNRVLQGSIGPQVMVVTHGGPIGVVFCDEATMASSVNDLGYGAQRASNAGFPGRPARAT